MNFRNPNNDLKQSLWYFCVFFFILTFCGRFLQKLSSGRGTKNIKCRKQRLYKYAYVVVPTVNIRL